MNFEWGFTQDSYGLGVLWDTKLIGRNVHGTLAQHMLLFTFINLQLAVYWG